MEMLSATISLGILKVKFVIIIFLQFCLKFQSLNLFLFYFSRYPYGTTYWIGLNDFAAEKGFTLVLSSYLLQSKSS